MNEEIQKLTKLLNEAAADAASAGWVCGMRNMRVQSLERALRKAKGGKK